MIQSVYPTIRTRQIGERPESAADKSNPFTPAVDAERARPERHGSLSTPNLDVDLQRQALLALRARLCGNVTHTADMALSGTVGTIIASPDTAEYANDIVEQDLAVSLLGNAHDTLAQIEAALQRLEDGSYGRCARCGTRIPTLRLEAIPYAACCVKCAARQERAH